MWKNYEQKVTEKNRGIASGRQRENMQLSRKAKEQSDDILSQNNDNLLQQNTDENADLPILGRKKHDVRFTKYGNSTIDDAMYSSEIRNKRLSPLLLIPAAKLVFSLGSFAISAYETAKFVHEHLDKKDSEISKQETFEKENNNFENTPTKNDKTFIGRDKIIPSVMKLTKVNEKLEQTVIFAQAIAKEIQILRTTDTLFNLIKSAHRKLIKVALNQNKEILGILKISLKNHYNYHKMCLETIIIRDFLGIIADF